MKMRTARIISAGLAVGLGIALFSTLSDYGKCKGKCNPAAELRVEKPEPENLMRGTNRRIASSSQLTDGQKFAVDVWRRTVRSFKEIGISPEQ